MPISSLRNTTLIVSISAALAAASNLYAGIIGTHWKKIGPDTWELYAEMQPGYRLSNADLGDTGINQPPAGINHGLFVSDGAFTSVTLYIGNSPGAPARSPSTTTVLDGENLNAAWFVIGGVFGSTIEGTTGGTILGVRVLTVGITPGARLGGTSPDGVTPSTILLFGNNGTASGTTSGVFNIAPIPGCPGDINGDGVVDLDDFIILAGNFGSGPGATLQQGDLSNDGFVNLDDFIILAGNFGNDCNS